MKPSASLKRASPANQAHVNSPYKEQSKEQNLFLN
jgi:hypothetical protein